MCTLLYTKSKLLSRSCAPPSPLFPMSSLTPTTRTLYRRSTTIARSPAPVDRLSNYSSSIHRSKPTTNAALSAWSAPRTPTITTMAHSRNTSTASKPMANIRAAHHGAPVRHVGGPLPTDYDTTHTIEARKYLKTYGLTPPGVDSFENQSKRCLAVLASRKTPIEKYQYLSVLRNTNINLFYRLFAENVKVGNA